MKPILVRHCGRCFFEMIRKSDTLFIYLICALGLLIAGLQTTFAQVQKAGMWRDAVVTELDVDFGNHGFHARWRFHRCTCSDIRVEVEQVAPDGTITGELMLVGGKILLSRGFAEQGGDIVPLIQAPTLMLQLAHAMLNRSQPTGPSSVGEKQAWSETEENLDLKLDTGMTTGTFSAPWSVSGSGWESGVDQRRFELLFKFTVSLPDEVVVSDSMSFSGLLDYRNLEFPYPESASLEGWYIQWISSDEFESRPVATGQTLKTLRQQAKKRP